MNKKQADGGMKMPKASREWFLSAIESNYMSICPAQRRKNEGEVRGCMGVGKKKKKLEGKSSAGNKIRGLFSVRENKIRGLFSRAKIRSKQGLSKNSYFK